MNPAVKTFRTLALAVTLAALALLPLGCDEVKAPGIAGPDPLPLGAASSIDALEGLSGYIVFSPPSIQSPVGKPMSVSVPMRLKSDQEIDVQYRFLFFDAAGRPVAPDPAWRSKHLAAREQDYMEADAPDTNARQWKLVIRPAR